MQLSLLTFLSVAGLSAALAVPAIPNVPSLDLPTSVLPTNVLPIGLPALPTDIPSLDLPIVPTLPVGKDVKAIEKRCSWFNVKFNPCVCPSQWGHACPNPPGVS